MFSFAKRANPSQMETLVSSIVSNKSTQDLLQSYGLNATHVTWEDTARSKGSCWGPNISDMTLCIKEGALMPVIRKPNFSDLTSDTPIEAFRLCVGNEAEGRGNKIVSLKEYLSNLETYCPDVTAHTSLLDPRDSVILTSTQCCVLPVKKGEKTEFAVQLFNYQSYEDDPAVLVILVTKDGTSAQILQKNNQTLFFNAHGKSHWLSVERLEDSRERRGEAKTRVDSFKEMKSEEKLENTIMMIQVPLVPKPRPKTRGICYAEALSLGGGFGAASEDGFDGIIRQSKCLGKAKGHGMDMGQVGIGSEEGPFIGTKGIKLVRDTRFPIRCTYQYYRVTDENFVSEKSISDIAQQLNQVVSVSVATGSLVFSDDATRKTEPVLTDPKPTDTPFGKPAHYKSVNTSALWGLDSMANF